jgi:hypothetical protein
MRPPTQVSIPIAGLSFGRVAAAVVDLMRWWYACRQRRICESFAAADVAHVGSLSAVEASAAIAAAQGCEVDAVEFAELLKEVDARASGRLSLRAYAWAFTQLGSLDQRVAEKRVRLHLTGACFVIWNIVGACRRREHPPAAELPARTCAHAGMCCRPAAAQAWCSSITWRAGHG